MVININRITNNLYHKWWGLHRRIWEKLTKLLPLERATEKHPCRWCNNQKKDRGWWERTGDEDHYPFIFSL